MTIEIVPEKIPHPHTEYEVCPGGCQDIVTVETKLNNFDAKLDAHITEARETDKALQELKETMQAVQGFIKVAYAVGKFLAWLGAIAAPIVAIYYTMKFEGKL